MIAPAAYEGSDEFPGQDSVLCPEGARHQPGKGRHGTHLEVVDVRPRFANHFLAGLAVDLQRRLVAHGSGSNEEPRLASKDLGRAFLEAIQRGVFAVNIVSHFRFVHGAPHGGGGPGDSVAA